MTDKKKTRKETVFNGIVDEGRKNRLVGRYEKLSPSEQKAFLAGRLLLNKQKASSLDGLTGLMNRRCGMRRCAHLVEAIKRHNVKHVNDSSKHQSLAVLFIDLDKFKSVNDTYGHLAGDKVLKTAAQCIKKSLRSDDTNVAMRYGGEEFVVVLKIDEESSHSPKDSAFIVAERMRKAVGDERISLTDAQGTTFVLRRTASLGVAVEKIDPRDSRLAEDILLQALDKGDQALYVAKERGRNRACVYHSSTPHKPEAGKKPAEQARLAHG